MFKMLNANIKACIDYLYTHELKLGDARIVYPLKRVGNAEKICFQQILKLHISLTFFKLSEHVQ